MPTPLKKPKFAMRRTKKRSRELILALAKKARSPEVVAFLSRAEHANIRDDCGRTALMLAARFESIRVVRELLKLGSDVNARDLHRETALHASVEADAKIGIVELLLKAGANPNGRTFLGRTPIIAAITNNRIQVIKMLIAYGAEVNYITRNDETPLSFAVIDNRIGIAKELIKAGSDVRWKDRFGFTLIEYALNDNHKRMAEILREAGGTGKI